MKRKIFAACLFCLSVLGCIVSVLYWADAIKAFKHSLPVDALMFITFVLSTVTFFYCQLPIKPTPKSYRYYERH